MELDSYEDIVPVIITEVVDSELALGETARELKSGLLIDLAICFDRMS